MRNQNQKDCVYPKKTLSIQEDPLKEDDQNSQDGRTHAEINPDKDDRVKVGHSETPVPNVPTTNIEEEKVEEGLQYLKKRSKV